jgi:hypothetical protein
MYVRGYLQGSENGRVATIVTGRLVLAYGPSFLGPRCPRAELSGIPWNNSSIYFSRF